MPKVSPGLRLLGRGLPLAALALLALPARAAVITQTGGDGPGLSSFNTGNRWPGNVAPSAGNDYETQYGLRTPNNVTYSVTFAGDSLTLLNGGGLVYKGRANGQAGYSVSVNLNIRTGGYVGSYTTSSRFTLAGSLTLDSGNIGDLRIVNNATESGTGFTVFSAISGAGGLRITYNDVTQSADSIDFTRANNTYTGGTTVEANAWLKVLKDGAIGTGDLHVQGGKLTLSGGTAHNYIADSASVVFSSHLGLGSIDLAFVGTDAIGSLSLDGGLSWLASGTYNADALNSLYGSNAFTGVGSFYVAPVPEPGSSALLGGAGVLLLAGLRRSPHRK